MSKYQFINLDFLRQFTQGDPVKMKKYINMFLQSAPEAIETMKKQHAAQDWLHLKTTAHSLKPQLAYMGIESLKETILRIEEYAGEKKNPEVILQLIQTVAIKSDMAFTELKHEIESFLN